MNNLKEINLKSSYNSDTDNILDDFYIPILSVSRKYQRIAGFFSSTSFALASRGMLEFLKNNGGMKMIVNKVLQREDKQIMSEVYKNPSSIDNLVFEDFKNWLLEDQIMRNHVLLFGWMLRNKLLDLKIAITLGDELFHQKIGILSDGQGNELSFSGSNNESASGWKSNIEEFKVFKNWRIGEKQYFKSDVDKFNHFWENKSRRAIVIGAPEALKRHLVQEAPKNLRDFKISDREIDKKITISRNEYFENIGLYKTTPPKILYKFQKRAINRWKKNKLRGILEMATGTGKTFTSVCAIKESGESKGSYSAIIGVPYIHLISQWEEEVRENLSDSTLLTVGGRVKNWDRKLYDYISDYSDGFLEKLVVITTYDTLSSEKFISVLKKFVNKNRPFLLVSDEVHNIGSKERRKIMGNFFQYRLGLSATPLRHMDEEGTELIKKYFRGSVFRYGLKKAIKNNYLTPYKYYPTFVQLTDDEYEKYYEISKKISKVSKYKSNIDDNELLKKLLINRSRILKNAENKIHTLNELLVDIKKEGKMDHLLIYFDSLKQIAKSRKVIDKLGIITHKFTQMEDKTKRELILKNFDSGIYHCLLAIKCLDEGVNVPSTRTAIIVASTTNPREYIQRRGRVLRKHKDKKRALIYDLTVLPPDRAVKDSDIKEVEKKLIKKEFNRIEEFLDTAENKTEIFNKIVDIMIKYDVYLD